MFAAAAVDDDMNYGEDDEAVMIVVAVEIEAVVEDNADSEFVVVVAVAMKDFPLS